MCTCSQPLEYEYQTRSSNRAIPIIEKSYDRHAHSHYPSSGRPRRSLHHMSEADNYSRDSGYGTTRLPLSSRRRSTTPPPVLIQSTPMGRAEVSPRLSPTSGGRFGRGGLDSPTSSIRSGEMGFNQPVVLQDGLGPIIHQGHSAHYQTSHHTGYAPHVHVSGSRSATPRRYNISSGNDRGRPSYIGYREGSGSSSLSDDSYGSERRLYTNDSRGGYGRRNSAEGIYHSTPVRRYS